MVDGTNLLGLKYAKGEYFRGGEEEYLNARSFWLNILKNEYKLLNANGNSKIGHELKKRLLKSLELSSKIYPLNKKRIWIGPLFNQYSPAFNALPYNLIASHLDPTLKSVLNLITSNVSFHPISHSCYLDIYSGILNNNKINLQHGLNKLEKILSNANLDLIIMHNDTVPINHAIVLVARELGIPTVELQHGIYIGKYVPNGIAVDYLFVWGQHFKNIYVKNGLKKEDKVKILGYPFQINKYPNDEKEEKTLTYLGQSYEALDEKYISIKIETIKNLQRICNDLNFDFIFRPHPRDDSNVLRSKLKDVNFTHPLEKLDETIAKGDIFVAFDSTSLIQANLSSKLSIQLKSYDFPTDNFEKIGACSKSVETYEELETLLKKIKENGLSSVYKPVKRSYMELPSPDLKTRFHELIEEII